MKWFVRCDSCGEVVSIPGRFRHVDCPPPEDIANAIAEIRAELERRQEEWR